jgi:hypothetical protein
MTGEVVLLAKEDRQAPARRIARDPAPIDAAADDGEVVDRPWHRASRERCAARYRRRITLTTLTPLGITRKPFRIGKRD